MTENINLEIDSEDLKEFQKQAGMSIGACVKLLIDNVKYGGKVGLDPFWSEENQTFLKSVIEDSKNGRNMYEHDLIEVD